MNDLTRSMIDINLGMLYLAREALQKDRALGMVHLSISPRVADLLLSLTHKEISQLANSPVLLVGLRWRSAMVWECLQQYAAGCASALPKALLIGEGELDYVH